jgi:hypothetical protein
MTNHESRITNHELRIMAGHEFSMYRAGNPDDISLDPITRIPAPDESLDNTFMNRVSAAMELSNPISRITGQGFKEDFPAVEGYAPLSDPQIAKYDPRLFTRSTSPGQTGQIIKDVEYSRVLQRQASGFGGVAGTVLGYVSNPLITAPAIATGGASLGAMVAADATAELVNEVALRNRQPERTMAETAINVTTAGLGTLGVTLAARKYLSMMADRKMGAAGQEKEWITPEDFERLIDVGEAPPTITPTAGVGADIVIPPRPTPQDVVEVPLPYLVRALGGTLISKAVDMVTNSMSEVAKQVTRDLVDVPIRVIGKATTSVEASVKGAEGLVADMEFFLNEQYKSAQP